MEIKEFIQNFAAQFDDVEPSGLSFATRFRDIEGWSSITALMLIAMFDEVYKANLSGEEMRNSETIEDLYNIVKSKK